MYIHIHQWRIYIQKFLACAPPPTGPNSFDFTYVFTEKQHLCRRLAPPPMRVGAPQSEILDPPLYMAIFRLVTSQKCILLGHQTRLVAAIFTSKKFAGFEKCCTLFNFFLYLNLVLAGKIYIILCINIQGTKCNTI